MKKDSSINVIGTFATNTGAITEPADSQYRTGLNTDGGITGRTQLNWVLNQYGIAIASKADNIGNATQDWCNSHFATKGGVQLPVGSLIWNDTNLSMPVNCMPAVGKFSLDPAIFPELYEAQGKPALVNGLFSVGISADYPYLSLMVTGRAVNSTEADAFETHTHTIYGTGFRTDANGCQQGTSGGQQYTIGVGSPNSGRFGTNTHPANTAVYLWRVTASIFNADLETALKDSPPKKVYSIATASNQHGLADKELWGIDYAPVNYQTTKWHYENNKVVIDNLEYWISENHTIVEPLEFKEGFTQLWDGEAWNYIEDHRGETVYSKADGSEFTITELGAIPAEYTVIAPPKFVEFYKFSTDEWILDNLKQTALIQAVTDIVKGQTNLNIEDSKWVKEGTVQLFQSAEEHLQFTNIEDAVNYISSLSEMTMEQLITILNKQ